MVVDSQYGCASFVKQTADIPCDQLMRLSSNRCFYGEPMGYNGRSGTGNDYGNWSFDRTAFSMPVSNNATYTAKVDGFDCWDQTGGTWGNANYKIMGFIQLWGMPKTTS